MDSRVLSDQQPNQRIQQPFTTHFHVVNELKKTEITWQLFLGNATMGSQPGGQVIKPFTTLPAPIFLSSRLCLISAIFGDARCMAMWAFHFLGPSQFSHNLVALLITDYVLDIDNKLRCHFSSPAWSEIQTKDYRKLQAKDQHPGIHIEPK